MDSFYPSRYYTRRSISAQLEARNGDLKAHNILIDGKGTAKVSDFCLNATTPYWMIPELLLEPSLKTAASDVYALGILLYEIYSKETPYEGEDVNSVLKEIVDP